MLKYSLIVLLFALAPLTTFAASHTYVCGDMENSSGGWGCSSGAFTASGNGDYTIDDDYSYDWTNKSPLYLTFTITGTGNHLRVMCRESGVEKCGAFNTYTVSQSETAITNTATTHSGIGLNSDFPVGFNGGTVSSFCVDDDGTSCTGGGGGSTPTKTYNFSTTTTLVDNPSQDIWNGFILFLMATWFMVWLFKKRT